MQSFQQLFYLVSSLTKSEKRYFNLFAGIQKGDKSYLKLYKLMLRDNDHEKVKQHFINSHSASVFEVARKYLYKNLMKSLRNYNSEVNGELILINLLAEVHILHKKKLIPLCLQQIEKVKNISVQIEKFQYFSIVSALELEIYLELEFKGIGEQKLINLQKEIDDALTHQLSVSRHASIYQILIYRYFQRGGISSDSDKERLNDLLLEEHQMNSSKHFNSFISNQLHLSFQSAYFLMIGEYELSLKGYYELQALFSENPNLAKDFPVYYLHLANGFLSGLRYLKKYDSIYSFVEGQEKSNKVHAPEFMRMLNAYKLILEIDGGDFNQGVSLVRRIEREGLFKDCTLTSSGTLLHINASVVFFSIGDYHEALRFLKPLLNPNANHFSHSSYSIMCFLNLLIHLELGNDDYLQYQIRAVERKLKLQKQILKTEQTLIKFFRCYLKNKRSKKIWEDLYNDLTMLSSEPFDNRFLSSFDFISWINSKRHNVSFASVVKYKHDNSTALLV